MGLAARFCSVVLFGLFALGVTGCSTAPVDPVPTTSSLVPDQVRIVNVGTSTLTGYRLNDTLRVSITGDLLSIEGGGGIAPVASSMPLSVTGGSTLAGTRSPGSGVIETYTVTVNSSGLVTALSVTRTGSGAGSLAGSAETGITTPSSLDGVWLVGNLGRAATDSGSSSSRATIDADGRLWWDMDGNDATTDDVVMFVLRQPSGTYVAGATVMYDWNGDSTLDVVELDLDVTTFVGGSPSVLRIAATPISVSGGGSLISEYWVYDSTVTSTGGGTVPTFGAWSGDMAGHWLGLPTFGSATLLGSVPVTRTEGDYDASNVLTTPILAATSGNEAEDTQIAYGTAIKGGIPVVTVTIRTQITKVGGGTESTRYALYFARSSTGVVYRVGLWEDANYNSTVDSGEETIDVVSPPIAFPAARPAAGATYVAFARWGISSLATHQENQTVGSWTKLVGQAGALSSTTTTPAPASYVSVTGAGTAGTLTTYWRPGSGIVAQGYASGTAIIRRFVKGDGAYRQINRQITAAANVVE